MEEQTMILPSRNDLMHEKPVVINPVSGNNSMKALKYLQKHLKDKGFHYYITKEKGDGARFISERLAAAEKSDKMLLALIVGGDGTCNEVSNADGNLDRLIVGIIPAGTGKDMARSLNMTGIDDICEIQNQIYTGKANLENYVKPIDLIKVSFDESKEAKANYLFSIGFDGVVCKEVNGSRRKGGFRDKNIYITKAIEVLREKKYSPIKIEYTLNNDTSTTKTVDDLLMFTIMNGRYAGSGINYNPEYSLNDGLLEGFLIKSLTLGEMTKLLWHVRVKKDNEHIASARDANGFNRFKINYMPGIKSASIKIQPPAEWVSDQEYYLNTDGEHHQIEKPDKPVQLDVLHNATYMMYIPEKKPK
jgi:diacylglycerol kinase (ATP)